jgi:hypothetical protein
MKMFWFIFSIYLALLSVFPCSDKFEFDSKPTETQTFFSSTTEHQHETEQCSPFCSCACCGISTTNLQKVKFTFRDRKIIVDKIQLFSLYKFRYFEEISSSIWQPPKLS